MKYTKVEYLERTDKLGIERHVALRWWKQLQKKALRQTTEEVRDSG